MTFWMRWLGLYAGSASRFSSKLLNCRHLLKTSAAWGWCPTVRDAGAVWTSNWFVSMETVDFRCFREVGGELSPWAWFCLSDWIGCCAAIVEQQPMKGLSISRWSQLGREARGSNLLLLWDSQCHSPPWHLKTRSFTVVDPSPKGELLYSAGSCTQTPQLGWLGNELGLYLTTPFRQDLKTISCLQGLEEVGNFQNFQVMLSNEIIKSPVCCIALRRSQHLKCCDYGWWFWDLFSKMKGNLVRPQKVSKHENEP